MSSGRRSRSQIRSRRSSPTHRAPIAQGAARSAWQHQKRLRPRSACASGLPEPVASSSRPPSNGFLRVMAVPQSQQRAASFPCYGMIFWRFAGFPSTSPGESTRRRSLVRAQYRPSTSYLQIGTFRGQRRNNGGTNGARRAPAPRRPWGHDQDPCREAVGGRACARYEGSRSAPSGITVAMISPASCSIASPSSARAVRRVWP
jgi:hypothetical protein